MSLVAALSCDLREDFYDRIIEFIQAITNIVLENYHDADVMNFGFNSISHIIYFLNRLLLNDTQNILNSLGYVLFAIFEGTDRAFHSKFDDLFPDILRTASANDPFFEEACRSFINVILDKHASADNLRALGKRLFDLINLATKQPDQFSPEIASNLLLHLCHQAHIKHCLFPIETFVADSLKALFSRHKSTAHQFALHVLPLTSESFNGYSTIRLILLDSALNLDKKLALISSLISWPNFERDVLPNVNSFLLQNVGETDSHMLQVLARICIGHWDQSDAFFNLNCGSSNGMQSCEEGLDRFRKLVRSIMLSQIESADKDFYACCVLLSSLSPLDQVLDVSLLAQLVEKLASIPFTNAKFAAAQSIAKLCSYFSGSSQLVASFNAFKLAPIVNCLKDTLDSTSNIPCVALGLKFLTDVIAISETCITTVAPFELFLPFLQAPSHSVRLAALNCLQQLCKQTKCQALTEYIQPVLTRCLAAENVPVGPHTVRDLLVPVLHLHQDRPETAPNNAFDNLSPRIAIHFLFGLLHVNFRPLWPAVHEALLSHCDARGQRRSDQEIFWPIFAATFNQSCIKATSDPSQNSNHEEWIKRDNKANECFARTRFDCLPMKKMKKVDEK
ncbi:hypothetical protein Ciccas_008709 [Cichlidogyrus casuarinus]|uniref:Uncharacterized protein n=1 Tax=Cichlidogyrus casuarinus TaxID=1844966 RepID=A0ABD2Q3G8_9PLAT